MLSSEDSRISHNMRLHEAETAKEHGIPFDKHWYEIDVTARAAMIAARVVRIVLNNTDIKQSRAKAGVI